MRAQTLKAVNSPLVLEERPPLSPRDDEVVVTLKNASLNRRDYWIARGLYPGIKVPVVLGSDGAGIVTKTGEYVDASWEGLEVIINPGFDWGDSQRVQSADFTILGLPRDGTFATEVAVPAGQLLPKPSHLEWAESAAIPLAGLTAYRALITQGEMQPGENVLVTGVGGGVATLALQFAVAAGATVWVTSSSDEKIERAVELGAKGGFNYRDNEWGKKLAAAAEPDLIVDGAAGPGYEVLVDCAAPGGRVVNYGATAGAPQKVDMFKVFWKQLRLQGTTMGSPADFDAMHSMVEQHKIRPVIDRTFSLSDANEAIEQMESSPQFGKITIAIDA